MRPEFTALFAGDLGFGEHYLHHPRARTLQRLLSKEGYGAPLAGLAPLIEGADVAVGNLEAPLSPRPDPVLGGRKRGLVWSDPDPAVAALRQVGFTALSLANDHALDCGRPGLADTRRLLGEAGIQAFGAGSDADVAGRPWMTRFRSGGRERTLVVFGMLEHRELYDQRFRWYTNRGLPGVNPMSPRWLERKIAELRESLPAPVFVVFPHWGSSYAPTSEAQRSAARQLVAAGADMVIGHGSHVAQTFEIIDGRPVLFGLGNAMWNTPGRYGVDNVAPYSLLATLTFSDDAQPMFRLIPILTDNMITQFRNRPLTDDEFTGFAAGYGGDWVHTRVEGAPCLEARVPIQEAAAAQPRRAENTPISRFDPLFELLRSKGAAKAHPADVRRRSTGRQAPSTKTSSR